MHDNFEKKVQEKMAELHLTPSAPVWENIEVAITPERKKRRGVIWLLALLLLTGGGAGIYFWQGQNKQQATTALPVTQPQPSVKKLPAPPAQDRSAGVPAAAAIYPAPPAVTERQSVTVAKVRVPAHQPGTVAVTIQPPLQSSAPPEREEKTTRPSPSTTDKAATARQHKPVVMQPSPSPQLPQKTAVAADTTTAVVETAEPPSMPPGTKAVATDSVLRKGDTAVKKKVAVKKSWRQGLVLAIGRTAPAGPLIGGGQASMPQFASPNSGGLPNVGGSFSGSTPPAVPTAGLAFSIGYLRTKTLSKRWSLTLGLQYSFLSTRQRVGSGRRADTTLRVDGANVQVEKYFGRGNNQSYTNQFHVIEVPALLNFKPSALPVSASVGLAYGRVVHTTALAYDAAAGVYFANSDNTHKNRLAALASVQAELFSKKKRSLHIGPMVQYNLLRTQKDAAGKNHLFFAGLQTRLHF